MPSGGGGRGDPGGSGSVACARVGEIPACARARVGRTPELTALGASSNGGGSDFRGGERRVPPRPPSPADGRSIGVRVPSAEDAKIEATTLCLSERCLGHDGGSPPSDAVRGDGRRPRHLHEPRVPHDAAALVAAAARLRGARSMPRWREAQPRSWLCCAPRATRTPSPRRLRARCGWALDHGVVDALVEAMRAHADCVPVQMLAATCWRTSPRRSSGLPRRHPGRPDGGDRAAVARRKEESFGKNLDFVFPAVPRRACPTRRAAR